MLDPVAKLREPILKPVQILRVELLVVLQLASCTREMAMDPNLVPGGKELTEWGWPVFDDLRGEAPRNAWGITVPVVD